MHEYPTHKVALAPPARRARSLFYDGGRDWTVDGPHAGGHRWEAPRAPHASTKERSVSAIQVCDAPGCARRAIKPCFDCGQWRCEEHLTPAVHQHRGAVVHLCPTCMQAHVDDPERLRIYGVEDTHPRHTPEMLLRRSPALSFPRGPLPGARIHADVIASPLDRTRLDRTRRLDAPTPRDPAHSPAARRNRRRV